MRRISGKWWRRITEKKRQENCWRRKMIEGKTEQRRKTSLWNWKRRMVWDGKRIYRKERRGKYLVVTEEEETIWSKKDNGERVRRKHLIYHICEWEGKMTNIWEGYLVVMEKKREENIWSNMAKENGEGIYLSIYLGEKYVREGNCNWCGTLGERRGRRREGRFTHKKAIFSPVTGHCPVGKDSKKE